MGPILPTTRLHLLMPQLKEGAKRAGDEEVEKGRTNDFLGTCRSDLSSVSARCLPEAGIILDSDVNYNCWSRVLLHSGVSMFVCVCVCVDGGSKLLSSCVGVEAQLLQSSEQAHFLPTYPTCHLFSGLSIITFP